MTYILKAVYPKTFRRKVRLMNRLRRDWRLVCPWDYRVLVMGLLVLWAVAMIVGVR